MTQHIKYPEEVRMEAIERMARIAEAQNQQFRDGIIKQHRFEYELRLLIQKATDRMRTIATEAIYGS